MDAFFEKLRGYVKMTEDLPFAEFSAYYQDVMAYLQANYQDMDEHALLQAHIICEIVAANADGWLSETARRACRSAGARLVSGGVICQEAPDEEALEKCRALGAALAQA